MNLGKRRRLVRRIIAAAVGLAIPGTGVVGIAATASAATLRDSIVAIAERELNDSSHNYEYRGSDNCTYYSGQVTNWPLCGPAGWRGGTVNGDQTYAWCANFAKYVWREGGVSDLAGLNPFARSFREYGLDNGTWHARSSGYAARPGDAIVFDFEGDGIIDHVGLVGSNDGGTVHTIEGNSNNRVSAHSYSATYSAIVGYASPVGADAVMESTGHSVVTGDVSVVRTGGGILAQYRLADDGWIWGSSQSVVGGGFGPWVRIGDRGGFAGRPAALVASNETVVVYARGTDGHIYGAGQPAPFTAFGGWAVMGSGQPTFRSDPTAVVTSDGLLAIYATATDGSVWGTSQSAPGSSFGVWAMLGGPASIASVPQALLTPNGGIALYVLGTDGKVYGTSQPAPNTGFAPWAMMGSGQPTFTTAPSPVATPSGLIALYATATDGYVWGASQSAPGTGFGAWVPIGGTGGIVSRPQPLIAYNRTIALYTLASNGYVYGVGQPAPNTAFGTWAVMGSGQTGYLGDPSAVVAANGAVVIYARSADGWVWGSSQSGPGTGFSPWGRIGS